MDEETLTGEENAENNNKNTTTEETTETTTEEVVETGETEVDPYEAELKRLEAEKIKAETIARQKAGALAEERKKGKALEDRIAALEKRGGDIDNDALVAKLKAEIKRDAEIEKLSTNPNEQKLIRHFIENNGLSVHDAWVLANKNVLIKAQERERELDEEELALARLSGASFGAQSSAIDPLLKAASDGLTEKERKNLSI